ncbi:MAG: nitroreductase family protein [Merdibacter sp.]
MKPRTEEGVRVIECIESAAVPVAYSERAVEKEKLNRSCAAAYWHRPEGTNRRCVSSCFRMTGKQVFLNYCMHVLKLEKSLHYGADAIILSLRTWNRQPHRCSDAAAAVENMLLAATELELGSCWIHTASVQYLRRCREKSISGCGTGALRMPGVLCDRLCRTGCSAERKTREYRQIYLMGASFPDASAYRR